MHFRVDDRSYARFSACVRVAASHEDVLPVPKLNQRVVPNCPTRGIITGVSLRVEQGLPVLRPLTVYVMLTGLPGTGGGKHNNVRVPGKGSDKNSASIRVQVFCNLQANDKLEAAAQVNRRA